MDGRFVRVLQFGLLLMLLACPVVAQDIAQHVASDQFSTPVNGANAFGQREADRPALHNRSWRYLLRSGDVLQLSFPLTPDFNQILTVQPDGFVTLRVLGDIAVAGQSLPQVTEHLRAAYSKILHNPFINIDLKEFEKPFFIVGGEVGHPGKYDLRMDTTVIQAVAIAGGFLDSSKHSQVLLIRRVSENWAEVKMLNVKKMLQARNVNEDMYLRPGDMVYVPKNTLSKVKPFIPIPGLGFSLGTGRF